jgi:hypothetical protein
MLNNEERFNSLKKKEVSKPVTEKSTIGMFDEEKRNHLLQNIKLGIGKAIQSGNDVIYTIGNDTDGFFEITILNSSLPTN